MKVGADTFRPCRRASTMWPSSCTKIITTKPIANVMLWNHNEYAATEKKRPKNLTKMKPNFSAAPPIARSAAPRRSNVRFRPPCGWIGRSWRKSSIRSLDRDGTSTGGCASGGAGIERFGDLAGDADLLDDDAVGI